MWVSYVSYEEEAILTAIVVEMPGNAIVKSTEILQEHYVHSKGKRWELHVNAWGMDYLFFFISPFSVAQTAICVLALKPS